MNIKKKIEQLVDGLHCKVKAVGRAGLDYQVLIVPDEGVGSISLEILAVENYDIEEPRRFLKEYLEGGIV